jgi:hypothetical protein
VTEGCLISVSRRGAGSGGRGIRRHRRCGAPLGGPSREAPGAFDDAPRTLTAGTAGGLSEISGPSGLVLNGSESVMPIIARLPGTFAEQTFKHRARDAIGLGGLAVN